MKYLACKKIFSEINFDKKGIAFCCNESRASTPFLPINDNKLRVDEFLDFRVKTIEQFKNGQMPCSPTCEHLKIADWPDGLTPIFTVVAMNNFTTCNCDCYYCSVKNTGKSEYKPIDYLEELNKRKYIYTKCIFGWGGGEVSIYKDFEKELEFSLKFKSRKVIHTNGIIFSPHIARALKHNTTLNVSPDSGTAETYLKVKGVDKFNEVKNNIKKYSRCESTIYLKYIFNEHNCNMDDLKGFVELCKISPNIEALLSLTASTTNSKEYDENEFLHIYWLIKMLKAENIATQIFTPFFSPDAIEKLEELCKLDNIEILVTQPPLRHI